MSTTLLFTTTRESESSTWFMDAYPTEAAQLKQWIDTYPGLVSSSNTLVNPLRWEHVYVFSSDEILHQFLIDIALRPEAQLRSAYIFEHNQYRTMDMQ